MTQNEGNQNIEGNQTESRNKNVQQKKVGLKVAGLVLLCIISAVIIFLIIRSCATTYSYHIKQYRLIYDNDYSSAMVDIEIKNKTNDDMALHFFVRCYEEGTDNLVGSGNVYIFLERKETKISSIPVHAFTGYSLKNSYAKVVDVIDVSNLFNG